MLNGTRPKSASYSVRSVNTQGNKPKSTVNPQRREKLKNLLTDKYCKKYGKGCTEELIKDEINKFLDKETLTEKELKELDKKIENLVNNKDAVYKLKHELKSTNPQLGSTRQLQLEDLERFKINDNTSMVSQQQKLDKLERQSCMSYSTRNSKYKSMRDYGYQDDQNSYVSKEKPIERLHFDEKGEWEAIAKFNKESFKEAQVISKIKDKAKKQKTKQELSEQMKFRETTKKNERREDIDYGVVVNQHVEYLAKLDNLAKMKEKEKMLYEKKIRDEQLVDNKKRKKAEFKSQREYELNLLKKIKNETEEEIQKAIRMKNEKHEELVKTLKENELHKIVLQERANREREDDIKAQVEYAKMLDRQEQERADYFKSKEKKGNTFTNMMIENVVKDKEEKEKKLLDTINKYQADKDRRYL